MARPAVCDLLNGGGGGAAPPALVVVEDGEALMVVLAPNPCVGATTGEPVKPSMLDTVAASVGC